MANRLGRNFKLEIAENGMVWTDITQTLGELNAPDYGYDEYHNARLIGAYHAHRALGDEYFEKWRQSLSLSDRIYINAYEAHGEWGRTDLNDVPRDRVTALGAALGASVAFSGLATAMAEMGKNIRAVHEEIGAAFMNGVSSGLNYDSGKDYIAIIERLKLRCWLESIYVPSAVACWVAGKLPSWALPAVLYSWLTMQMAHEGDIIRRWLRMRDDG